MTLKEFELKKKKNNTNAILTLDNHNCENLWD